ncbi:MAG: c-type cytochrome [Aquificaceae bacterium]|nr:c-type cytochrome [Aquificaceae bacterium]MDW8237210.1 c-type cytochrome [Aquificaceae bacterium]
MRKVLILSVLSIMLFSCQQKQQASAPSQEMPAKPQEAKAPQDERAALASEKGCFACHDVNVKKVGPSFKEVASKYEGITGSIDTLAKRIKNGGSGKWGNVPMPPQNVTEEEAKKLAEWVMSVR